MTKESRSKPAGKGTAERARRREPSRGGSADPARKKGEGRVHLVTGYPGFVGKRLVDALAKAQPASRVLVLVQPKFEKEALQYAASIAKDKGRARIELLVGDVVDMDLGLSGEEYSRLVDEATDIFHLASIYYLGVGKEHARRVNVHGTRRMLELAREMKRLRRFNHLSTAFVCGDRTGVIAEDELEMGQRFRNSYEETKYEAEIEVRDAREELPVSIYRPSVIVGDSRTGEIDRFNGPYYLGILLVTTPLAVPLPLPGDGIAPLNVVPADFVVDAMIALGEDPKAVNKTFHLVDPSPMSSRRVYELIAEKTGKRLPRVTLSYRLTDKLMRLPGLEKLIRQQRQAVEYVNHLALFNCHNTLELLDGTGVRCPPLTSYLDRLMAYVRSHYRRQRRGKLAAVEDSLDDAPPSS